MLRKGWLTLYMTLLGTVGLMLCFLFFGSLTAVTSLVAVLGLLLAIIEFFFLHIISVHQEPPPHNPTGQKRLASEKRSSLQPGMFRRSRFTRRDDDI